MPANRRFRLQIKDGRRYVVAPSGKVVLHYYSLSWGRLGNLKEFNLWTVDAKGHDDESILCCHGVGIRSILGYLNGRGAGKDAHEVQYIAAILDQIREEN